MKESDAHISFHLLVPYNLIGRIRLRNFIISLFQAERYSLGELTFVFCDDEYLLDLNQRFLKHDYYTDILTFPGSASPPRTVSGEIYISVDRVRDNAKNRGLTFKEEMHRVMFHGALHLCGYRDKTKQDQARMRSKENDYLKRYFK